MKKRWLFKEPSIERAETLSRQLNISPVLAAVMINRGIADAEAGAHFLRDDMDSLADALLLKGAEKAAERIETALAGKESIVVYGDYDVDGITSTSLVYEVLVRMGGDPAFYIPERQSEGYGLNRGALGELAERGTDLIITVDCGISSYDLVEEFKDKVCIVITDHHEPPEKIPDAFAVVNPKQPGCPYPYKDLAGVGVAYALCRVLWRRRFHESLQEYTELVALGTIADLVPLMGENRILTAHGLARMAAGHNAGISALAEAASIDIDHVNAGNVAFSLAPRLNAAGRISHAEKSVFLLLEKDGEKARETAVDLNELNRERQDIERSITRAAIDEIKAGGYERDNVLVAAGDGWHSGVIGIAASRLVEKYYKPALVIAVADGVGKGSCRSIAGFHMYEALSYCSDLLIQYGGHAMAAGFSVAAGNIDALRQRLKEFAAQTLTPEDYVPTLAVDAALTGADITLDGIRELSRLEPYGMGNGRPVFVLTGATVDSLKEIGRDKTHLRLAAKAADGSEVSAVGWSMAELTEEFLPGDEVDLAFQLDINSFRGNESARLVLKDARLTTAAPVCLNRDFMVAVYKALRAYMEGKPKAAYDVREYLCGALPQKERHTLLAALQFCRERGILTSRTAEDDIYYEMPVQAVKLSLSDSATYVACGGR